MITVPYWWHATLLELLWLTGGLVAGWLTLLNLRDAWKDTEALERIRLDTSVHDRHYRMIELAAKGRMGSHTFRLIITALIVGAGAIAVLTSNPLRGTTTYTGLAVTVCLDGIAILTAIRSYADLRNRTRLYDLASGRSDVLAAKLRGQHLTENEEPT